MTRRSRTAVAVLLVCCALVACGGPARSPGPQIVAGPDAGSAGCLRLASQLPGTLLDRKRGSTKVAGAALWGDPAIVLRCGVAAPGPSADQCIEVNDVDWLFTENTSSFLFVTYGREPAAELTIPKDGVERTQASGALSELTRAAGVLPVRARCTGQDDL